MFLSIFRQGRTSVQITIRTSRIIAGKLGMLNVITCFKQRDYNWESDSTITNEMPLWVVQQKYFHSNLSNISY